MFLVKTWFDLYICTMKYLIIGLGNPGEKYAETRHNIGFKVLDAFAKERQRGV